ncbi:TonB C-terminal domain-containing protein [Nitrosophilus alvini]|uniref:TonB C-terminal domain-containing protein n=1 Tax=Nitrosophilus alvini TaxID=2714855 RepID=UPI00190BB57F|nr:TonB C-terminal domain-containing protein [Nitrosophilus alvini]
MDKKKIFLISGFLSFAVYIATLTIMVLFFIKKEENLKKYSMQKKKSIEVTLLTPEKKKQLPKKAIPAPPKPKKKAEIKKEKPKPKPKKRGSRSPKREVDISKLFSTVDTKKIKKIKKTEPQRKKSEPPSRFKGKSAKPEKKAEELLKRLEIKDIQRSAAAKSIQSVEGENDPYYAKIYEILYKYWYPSEESAGNKAKVKIIIDEYGNLDYDVLLYSNSEQFNKELNEYLEFMKTKKFPVPKEGRKEIVVYFEAKG